MHPIDVVALAVTVLICAVAPLTLALALGRRMRLPMRIVAVASGFYLVNLLLQQPIFLGLRPFVAGGGVLLTAAIAPSAVYAVSEEVVRYLSWRAGDAMRSHRTSNGAIVAGLAWGGTESLLLTAMLLAGALSTGTSTGVLTAFLLGRVCAVVTHVGFAHLSLQAYRGSALFLPLVIVAHFGVDASVFGLIAILGPASPWPTVLFAVLAVAALAVTAWLRRRWGAGSPRTTVGFAEQRSS